MAGCVRELSHRGGGVRVQWVEAPASVCNGHMLCISVFWLIEHVRHALACSGDRALHACGTGI